MKLNMKAGERGIIVKSTAGNEGKIVQVLRLATAEELDAEVFVRTEGLVWIIDSVLIGRFGGRINLCPDQYLRPIRDSDGEDETLTWAGKPEQVAA